MARALLSRPEVKLLANAFPPPCLFFAILLSSLITFLEASPAALPSHSFSMSMRAFWTVIPHTLVVISSAVLCYQLLSLCSVACPTRSQLSCLLFHLPDLLARPLQLGLHPGISRPFPCQVFDSCASTICCSPSLVIEFPLVAFKLLPHPGCLAAVD